MTEISEPHEGETFEIARSDFREAADFALQVSFAIDKEPTTIMGEYASIVHARMCANAASVEHQFSAPFIDQSAIMSLCRMILEAMILYFYLIEEVSDEEMKCRYALLHLHDTVNRLKLVRGYMMGDSYKNLLETRDAIHEHIKNNSHFSTLKKEQQDRLLTGEHFYIHGVRKAVEHSAGWNPNIYFAYHSYFSAHAHSAPMSFFRFKQHGSSFLVASSGQRSGVATALCFAEFALLRTALAALSGSPKLTMWDQDALTQLTRKALELMDTFNNTAPDADGAQS